MYVLCQVCHRVLREEDGPICVFCRDKEPPKGSYPETDDLLDEAGDIEDE